MLALAIAILSLELALPAGERVGGSARRGNPEARLSATVELVSQQYCGVEIERRHERFGRADFRVHIRIQNGGKEPVILCEKCVFVFNPVIRYAGSGGSVGADAYKMEPSNILSDEHYSRDLKDYTILQPGETYEVDETVGFDFRISSEDTWPTGVPGPGQYQFGVILWTWNGPPGASDALRKLWRDHGYLFDGEIDSALIPLKIEPPHDIPSCNWLTLGTE